MPEPVSHALDRFIAWCPDVVHPLLFKQPGTSNERRLFIVRTGPALGAQLHYDDRGDDFLAALQDAYAHPGPLRDMVLVCTHGKKDKCCAKFGGPVHDQLKAELANDVEVFQCSHFGGDRFAASVLWLPHGIYLGHVQNDLPVVIAKLRSRRIPLSRLRGRACLPSAAQFFEGHLRNRLGLDRPGVFELQAYDEKDVAGRLHGSIILRHVEDGSTWQGYVRVVRGESPVLASCNLGAETQPRIFALIDAAAFDDA